MNRLALGGGYPTSTSDTTSFFADVSYVNWEVYTGALLGSVDDNGYGIAVGSRSNITERLELEGAVSFVDFGDGAGLLRDWDS